jgi:hypothetical protein
VAVSPKFRLTVGQLVSVSLGIYLRNIIPFLFLGTLVLGPWIAFELCVPLKELPPSGLFAAVIGMILLVNVLTDMLTAAITYGVVMQMRGTPAGLVDCIGKGISSFAHVIGTGVVVGLRILVWLFTIYGIIREPIRLFVAVPVAVMEDKAGNAAARRSVELVRGNGAAVLWSMALTMVVNFGVNKVATFLMVGLDPEFDQNDPLLGAVIAVPVQTFLSTMMAVAYFLLRKGKENVDAAAIAKVFD